MESTTSAPSTKPPVSEQPAAPIPEKKSRDKVKKIIIVAVLGLIIILGALYYFVFDSTRGASAVSNKFVSAIQKEDTGAAYALTSDGFKGATSQTELESIFASVSPFLQGSAKVTNQKAETRNNQSYFAYVYTVKTKTKDGYIKLVLIKENNKWSVNNFRVSPNKLEANIE